LNEITGNDAVPRRPTHFTQDDVKRAVRGAVAAGIDVANIEIDACTGNIVISTPRGSNVPISAYDKWKAEMNAG
jgi:hypothetical protein